MDWSIFESWIVEDPEKDKATALGLDVKKGDWVTAQKIDSPEVWKKVKNKELTGFSIEAYLEPVLINNKIEMTDTDLEARIKKIMMESDEEKKTPEALAEAERLKKEEEDKAKATEMEAPTAEELQKLIDEKDVEINELKAKIAEMESGNTQMSSELEATKKVVTEMSEQIQKGIKPTGVSPKSYEEMSNKEKALYNRGKL